MATSKAPRLLLSAAALLLLPPAARGKGLTDEPIVAHAHQPLSGREGGPWTAFSSAAGISIPATVPGDLITDL